MPVRVHKSISAVIVFVLAACSAVSTRADSVTPLRLWAEPSTIAADGKSVTTITAQIPGAPNGTPVTFNTTLGTLSSLIASSVSGEARVTLTSSSTPGTATVTASYGDASGDGTRTVNVTFTGDPELASTNVNSRWLRVDCSDYLVYKIDAKTGKRSAKPTKYSYLVYSADAKMIQAEGRQRAAHLQYHSLTIDADSIQVDIQTMQVVARNAVLRRGKASLVTAQLQYDLYTLSGTAVLPETDTASPLSVTVSGGAFSTVPLKADAAAEAVQYHVYGENDLSDSRLIVSAKSIAVDPGIQIQFTRATIYSDGKKVLAVPFHVMPLTTDQLFGEQIVGYTSEGIFVNIPYYYHVSPDSTGTIYVRNSATADASVDTDLTPTFGSTGTRPGLALDLEHTYSLGTEGTGSLILNSLTRSDWGAQWNHSERIDPRTNGFIYIDYPEHHGLFGSSDIRHQFANGYSLALSATDSINPSYYGYSSASNIINAYVQAPGKSIGKSIFGYVTNFSTQAGELTVQTPTSSMRTNILTQAADVRFFTPALHPDKKSNISDSLTVGQSWDPASKAQSLTFAGTVGAMRTLPSRGQLSLNYNYSYDPLLANYSQSAVAGTPFGIVNTSLQQSVSLTAALIPSKRSTVALSSNYALPYHQTSIFSNFGYRIDNNWGFGISTFYDDIFSVRFSSVEFEVTRHIFGRSLIFSYGTDTHRLRFSFGAGSF